jgi:hypothetical protein
MIDPAHDRDSNSRNRPVRRIAYFEKTKRSSNKGKEQK